MAQVDTPVRDYMSVPVHTISTDVGLTEAARRLEALGISALPVLGPTGVAAGVLSVTDLLRVGRLSRIGSAQGGARRIDGLPRRCALDVMHPEMITVGDQVSVRRAARLMVQRGVHRLFVAEGGRLSGVISTQDMMRAVVDCRIRQPMADFMTRSVGVVATSEPVAAAVDKLTAANVHGLVVVDEQWPVGVFTQMDALASREGPPEAPVEDWMTEAILTLPSDMPMHRVAAHALAMDVRRVLAMGAEGVQGIVAGTDFAKALAL